MNDAAIKDLLYRIADDQLILGHRNSEWTGMGPLLEEDIAFSSMAQDKIGQSQALYSLLHSLGEDAPDTVAFMREAPAFRNCIFVELPNGDYDFSLVRHLLYDTAIAIRFEMLTTSTYKPLAQLSLKIKGELKYHTLHANTWIIQLGNATSESISRLQTSLDMALPYALGMFEPSSFEDELRDQGVFMGELELRERWERKIKEVMVRTKLDLSMESIQPIYGGRFGNHSEHLQPLLHEMSEVLRSDPHAEW